MWSLEVEFFLLRKDKIFKLIYFTLHFKNSFYKNSNYKESLPTVQNKNVLDSGIKTKATNLINDNKHKAIVQYQTDKQPKSIL